MTDGVSPELNGLHYGLIGGHDCVVEFWLRAGLNPNIRGKGGLRPMQIAAGTGNNKMISALIEHGADPDLGDDDGWRPIHHAAKRGYSLSVALLARHGANIHVKQADGYRALALAVKESGLNVAQAVLDAGGSPNDYVNSVPIIHIAVFRQLPELVKLLLERGADPNARDRHGFTALMQASYCGQKELVEMLLKMGATVNAQDNFGRTALMAAAIGSHDNVASVLVSTGAVIDTVDSHGRNALDYAVCSGSQVLKRQLEHLTRVKSSGVANTSCPKKLIEGLRKCGVAIKISE